MVDESIVLDLPLVEPADAKGCLQGQKLYIDFQLCQVVTPKSPSCTRVNCMLKLKIKMLKEMGRKNGMECL